MRYKVETRTALSASDLMTSGNAHRKPQFTGTWFDLSDECSVLHLLRLTSRNIPFLHFEGIFLRYIEVVIFIPAEHVFICGLNLLINGFFYYR
jgi:hypothetical protein